MGTILCQINCLQFICSRYTPGVTMSSGVFPWMAPEIVRAPEKVSQKVDVYSFAVVLWELWTLQSPFGNRSFQELVSEMVNTDHILRPELPTGQGYLPIIPEIGPGWRDLVERCWSEDPEDRPDFR